MSSASEDVEFFHQQVADPSTKVSHGFSNTTTTTAAAAATAAAATTTTTTTTINIVLFSRRWLLVC